MKTPRPLRPGLLLLPGIGLVVVLLGGALASLLGTSLGLQPLFGAPVLSIDGYAESWPALLIGARESVLIAAPATVLALAVGLPTALLLDHGRRAGPGVRGAVGFVLASPHLVGATAVALLLGDGGIFARLLASVGVDFGGVVGDRWPIATVLVFAWKESAFVALVVAASLGTRLGELQHAAAVLGASPAQRWRTVTVPLAAPGAVAAAIIIFVYALGAYEVSWLLGPASPESLPVMAYRLYGSIDLAARPQAAATALTSIALSVGAAALTVPVLRRLGATR